MQLKIKKRYDYVKCLDSSNRIYCYTGPLVKIVWPKNRKTTGSEKSSSRFSIITDKDGKIEYRRKSPGKHNGHMPALLLAPYRAYGSIFLGLGMLAVIIIRMFAG